MKALIYNFIDKDNIQDDNNNVNNYADPSKILFGWEELYWNLLYYYFI